MPLSFVSRLLATPEQKAYEADLRDPAKVVAMCRAADGRYVISADDLVAKSPAVQGATVDEGHALYRQLKPLADVAREKAFQHLIQQPGEPGEEVHFTAGGPGSGKSSVAAKFPSGHFVYDSTFRDQASAERKVQQALDSGRDVRISLVVRDPAEAMRANVSRAATAKRVAAANGMAAAHVEARRSVKALADKYAGDPRVTIDAFLNRTNQKPIGIPLSEVPDLDLDQTKAAVHGVLDDIEAGRDAEFEGQAADCTISYARGTPGGGGAGTGMETEDGNSSGEDGGEDPGSEAAGRSAAQADSRQLDRLSPAERKALVVLFAFALAARVLYAFIFRFDSDEAQHLHVVWAWTQGLLPFRDIFDNHAPLFHILCVPLLRLLGERADILIWMRLGMTLPAALCSWGVYRLGRQLYSPRAGAWAALLAMLEPHFFYTSTEFRADDLWAAAWVLFLAMLAASRGRPGRLFLAGILLGLTFGVSLKTSLLVLSLLCAGGTVAGFLLAGRSFRFQSLANWRSAAVFLAGLVLIPALLFFFFRSQGALVQAQYCLVTHNIVPGLKRWENLRLHTVVFCVAVPLLVAAAFALYRRSAAEARVGVWRAVLLLVPGFYYALLWCFWPDVTREDNLPFSPLVMLNAAPALLGLAGRLREPRWRVPAAAAIIEFGLIFQETKPWHNDTARDVATYAAVLSLTKPTDYVMDAKAGAIYRRRPYYFVLETITRARMKIGAIKDDIGERLIATHTGVVLPGSSMKRLDSGFFVARNYLPLNIGSQDICVPGQALGGGSFAVSIPADYVFIQPDGTLIKGALDGRPVEGPVGIAAGKHLFVPAGSPAGAPVVLFWANAWEKGYRPSLERQADFVKDLHGTGRPDSSG